MRIHSGHKKNYVTTKINPNYPYSYSRSASASLPHPSRIAMVSSLMGCLHTCLSLLLMGELVLGVVSLFGHIPHVCITVAIMG
jgi:hypothetical protein